MLIEIVVMTVYRYGTGDRADVLSGVLCSPRLTSRTKRCSSQRRRRCASRACIWRSRTTRTGPLTRPPSTCSSPSRPRRTHCLSSSTSYALLHNDISLLKLWGLLIVAEHTVRRRVAYAIWSEGEVVKCDLRLRQKFWAVAVDWRSLLLRLRPGRPRVCSRLRCAPRARPLRRTVHARLRARAHDTRAFASCAHFGNSARVADRNNGGETGSTQVLHWFQWRPPIEHTRLISVTRT